MILTKREKELVKGLAEDVLRVTNNHELCPVNIICLIERMMENKLKEISE